MTISPPIDLCEWNVDEAATKGLHPPKEVVVVDCTLREGEQTPGAVFRREDKLMLADAMVAAGFRQLEIGMPAISPYEEETIRLITGRGLDCLCFVVSMATRDDVLRAKDCGADGIGLSLPSGRLQVEKKLGWTYDRVVDTAVELTAFAHEQGLRVTLSPYDTFRAAPAFLERYLTTVMDQGHMDRVRLVDTVGCAAPHAVTAMVAKMREWTRDAVPIEVHCHNDFGFGLANTIAGVMAGAGVVSTTINGLGERAGGASTLQVIAALELVYGVHTGVDIASLTDLSRLVERISGIQVQAYEPLVGPLTYQMETGSVLSGYFKDPAVAFPFPPALVGGKVTVVLGKKSGRQSVQFKVNELGLPTLGDAEIAVLLKRVKDHAEATAASVPDELFRQWVSEETASAGSPR